MSERSELSVLTRLSPEQMQRIEGMERQFMLIFQQMLQEQVKTNALLTALIETLADEQIEDEDGEPLTYMDGTPIDGSD